MHLVVHAPPFVSLAHGMLQLYLNVVFPVRERSNKTMVFSVYHIVSILHTADVTPHTAVYICCTQEASSDAVQKTSNSSDLREKPARVNLVKKYGSAGRGRFNVI